MLLIELMVYQYSFVQDADIDTQALTINVTAPDIGVHLVGGLFNMIPDGYNALGYRSSCNLYPDSQTAYGRFIHASLCIDTSKGVAIDQSDSLRFIFNGKTVYGRWPCRDPHNAAKRPSPILGYMVAIIPRVRSWTAFAPHKRRCDFTSDPRRRDAN